MLDTSFPCFVSDFIHQTAIAQAMPMQPITEARIKLRYVFIAEYTLYRIAGTLIQVLSHVIIAKMTSVVEIGDSFSNHAGPKEGAPTAVREAFRAFRWQTIGRQHAEREALRQSRAAHRLGENDAWQVAIAECMDAIIVGHDPRAFGRLGDGYEDHRRS